MAREHDEISRRPDRVIILDADDPMHEIHGRFVWQEEHDRVVDEVRRLAFAEGFTAGRLESAAHGQIVLKRRMSPSGYVRAGVAVVFVLLFLLMLPVLLT